MNKRAEIGFSMQVRLDWLERTANLLMAGNTRAEVRHVLNDLLKDQLSVGSDAEWGCRGKTISILLGTWVSVPRDLQPLRDDALDHLRRLPVESHLPVHWGMAMAVYPFFGTVAAAVGRLVRLQGVFTTSQLQRRLREQLGERRTVSRAVERVVWSLLEWGVLQRTALSVHAAGPVQPVEDRKLAAWLIEATLLGSGIQSSPLKSIIQSPALFPFAVASLNATDLESSGRLELFRQGLDEDVVYLREAGTPQLSLPL